MDAYFLMPQNKKPPRHFDEVAKVQGGAIPKERLCQANRGR
jgi:hypothetical protein